MSRKPPQDDGKGGRISFPSSGSSKIHHGRKGGTAFVSHRETPSGNVDIRYNQRPKKRVE